MCLAATIFRPLRSKRAMISPDSPRAKASGLTRIRVRSMAGSLVSELAGLDRRLLVALLVGGGTPTAPRLQSLGDLRLAVRAHRPVRLERLAARDTGVLELALAVRAAQEVLLDLVVAVRAEQVAHRVQPRLGGLHLELALAHVVEVLRRADDHVDDRADEREQARDRRAGHQHGIGDAAPGV